MIAFKITRNGREICTAGAEDLAVLSAIVSATGKLGSDTVPSHPDRIGADVYFSVGGLTGRKDPKKDVHVDWESVSSLNVGDVITVTVIETSVVDRPKRRRKADSVRKRPS